MAINISYDPSDDPEAIAAAEARDAENLELGEQMIQDQQDLLAGKYKNAEELEKAYMELQQRFSKGETPDPEPADDVEESNESSDYERYDEEGTVNYDAVKEAYGDNLANVFQESGIDPWEMNDHFYQQFYENYVSYNWDKLSDKISSRSTSALIDFINRALRNLKHTEFLDDLN